MGIVRYRLDPSSVAGLSAETIARLDAMTPEDIEENARTDPDNPPSTEEELARGVFGRDVRLLRERFGLTQQDFAARYHIDLGRLQDWEQGRYVPDTVVLAYLQVIAREPERVARILEAV